MSPLSKEDRKRLHKEYQIRYPEEDLKEHPLAQVNLLWEKSNNSAETTDPITRLWTNILAWLKSKNIEL